MPPARLLTLIAFSFISGLAHPESSCHHGYDSRKCLRQEIAAREQLNALYAAQEQDMLEKLKGYEPDYLEQAIQQRRKSNRLLEEYRDTACISDQLSDGMSLRDAWVLADACRLEWRVKTIEALCLDARPSMLLICERHKASR